VHAAIPSQKSENSKNPFNLFSYSQLQYKTCGLINGSYYVTLPSPQAAKHFDPRAAFVAAWLLEGRSQLDLRDICKIGG